MFADPAGGLYANRAANAVVGLPPESGEPALDEPGFKVLHTQDFDFETTCLTLVACLSEIDAWSVENPGHLPIMVLVELKDLSVPEAAAEEGLELTIDLPWAAPVETSAEVLAALDAEVRSVFSPDRLFEPDDLRGDAATLDAAVGESGWPAIDELRGQVIVALNDAGAQRELYIADTPVLEGRPMFTSSTPGAPDAAFVRFDDPLDPALDDAAAAGYLIRTRTDSPTVDARENDTTARDAALAGGAHFLSTDYYEPSTFFDSPYVVALPGDVVARCNPVTAPPTCTDASRSPNPDPTHLAPSPRPPRPFLPTSPRLRVIFRPDEGGKSHANVGTRRGSERVGRNIPSRPWVQPGRGATLLAMTTNNIRMWRK